MDPIDPNDIPLRDIHLPEAISWWPPATGWWLMLALLIAAAVLVWMYLRKQTHNHQQKILQSLQTIEDQFKADGDKHRLARQISVLARQVTLLQYQDDSSEQRALIGDGWTGIWQQRFAGEMMSNDELHRALNIAPYREQEEIDGEKLIAAFRQSVTSVASTNSRRSP